MGSGKSTLGARLAARLAVPFVDLDIEIAQRTGTSIVDLVGREGEAAFRRYELDALLEIVRMAPPACVIATGGGIVETPAAHAALRALGRIVWLRADPEASVSRLGAARAERPFLASDVDWRERWRHREPLYLALADAVVSTHPETEDESLDALGERIRSAP
jgi:shikimate kinase